MTWIQCCNAVALFPQDPSPSYDVSTLTVPTALFTGGQDWIADPQDVAGLLPKLKATSHLLYHKDIPYYNHLDFIWGMDAAKVVYGDILDLAHKMLDT